MKLIPISGAFQVPEGIDKDELSELFFAWTRSHDFGFVGSFDGGQITVDQSEFGMRINTGTKGDTHKRVRAMQRNRNECGGSGYINPTEL